jgi:hypothetical protein
MAFLKEEKYPGRLGRVLTAAGTEDDIMISCKINKH